MSSPTRPAGAGRPGQRPVDAAVADYLAAVGHDLAGIPEGGAPGHPRGGRRAPRRRRGRARPGRRRSALEARLGPAKTYAAELRAAAGYDAPPRARLDRVA